MLTKEYSNVNQGNSQINGNHWSQELVFPLSLSSTTMHIQETTDKKNNYWKLALVQEFVTFNNFLQTRRTNKKITKSADLRLLLCKNEKNSKYWKFSFLS